MILNSFELVIQMVTFYTIPIFNLSQFMTSMKISFRFLNGGTERIFLQYYFLQFFTAEHR